MNAGLNRQARAGALWSLLNSGVKHGMDLLVFLLLARWLTPQAFGMMALVSTALVVVLVFAELGLAEALVQRKRLAGVTVDTAFWLLLGVGLALAAGLAALAIPLAHLYKRPDLAPVVWSLCPLVLAVTLNAVPQALMQRALRFRPLALRGMASTVVGGATGLGLAWAGADVWSLVGQQLVAAVVGLALLWLQTEWRPKARFSPAAVRRLMGFGRHVLLTRCLNVVASKVDDAVVGWFLGPGALGMYAVASRLRLALEQLFCQGIDAVALSTFSRLAAQRQALATAYLGATRTAINVAAPVFLSAAWLAPSVLPALIGPQWSGAMGPLRALLLAGLLQAFLHFNHAVFRAVNRPQRSWQLGLASLMLNVLMVSAVVRWGVQAVAWAYLVRVALIGPWGVVLVLRELGLSGVTYWRSVGPSIGAAVTAAALTVGLKWALTQSAMPVTSETLHAALAWAPAMVLCCGWLLWQSPWLPALRLRLAAGGSRTRKWVPGASRGCRPA